MKHHGQARKLFPIRLHLPEIIQQAISMRLLRHVFFKSVGNKATIAGASIAGIIALIFVVFLVVFLFRRRRFQCLQENQQHANRVHVSNNTTYDGLVFTSERQDDNHTYNTLS